MGEVPEGVKLQTIEISAATPDVLTAAIKRVTEAVMEAIPEDVFKKVAEDVVNGGEVIYKKNDHYRSEARYSLAGATGEYVSKSLDTMVRQAVTNMLKTEEVQKLVFDIVKASAKAALNKVPELAMNAFAERITAGINGSAEHAGIAEKAIWSDYVGQSGLDIRSEFQNFINELSYNNPQLNVPNLGFGG